MQADAHARLTPDEARRAGCTCEFGCRTCGIPEYNMADCPAWAPCPMGRSPDPNCPLTHEESDNNG